MLRRIAKVLAILAGIVVLEGVVCAQVPQACDDWTHITNATGTFGLSGNASGTIETAPYTKLQYEINQSVNGSFALNGNTGIALVGPFKNTVMISARYTTTYNPPGGDGYTHTESYRGNGTQDAPYFTAELQIDLSACHFSFFSGNPQIEVTKTEVSTTSKGTTTETSTLFYPWGPARLPSGDVSVGPPQRMQPLAAAYIVSALSFAAQDLISDFYGVNINWTSKLELSGTGGDLGPQTGGSSVPAPQISDSSFVAESADKSCQYLDKSPFLLSIPIKRVVGDVDENGLLVDPEKLIANGVVSPYATLRLSVYDVDSDAPIEPELDWVSVNKSTLDRLKGLNDKWVVNEILVPITSLRFGKRNPGSDPTPGMNEIQISIDVLSQSLKPLQLWCMGVDWAQLEFKALSPVIMVNGNNSSHQFWEDFDFIRPFQDQSIPFYHMLDVPTAKVTSNATFLASKLPQKAREFGAKWVHVVAHSKGGLDMRQMLTNMPADFGIRSLTTLSTPHHGSALADFGVYAPQASPLWSEWSGQFVGGLYAGTFDADAGRPDMTTAAVRAFNLWNAGNLPKYFLVDDEVQQVAYNSFSADANVDGSVDASGKPTIQDFEKKGVGFFKGLFTQFAYRTLWEYASASLVTKPTIFGTELILERELNDEPQLNDFLVTVKSAELNPPFIEHLPSKDNHATIANQAIALQAIDGIRAAQPVK